MLYRSSQRKLGPWFLALRPTATIHTSVTTSHGILDRTMTPKNDDDDDKVFLTRAGTIILRSFSTSTTNLQHQLNINKALKKKDEGDYFQELMDQPATILQGIGPKHAEHLSALGLDTISQLSNYKFFHLSRSLVTLASVEEAENRLENSAMNVNKGLDKEYEHLPLTEIIQQPVHALQGISPTKGEIFASLGVKTIADLSSFKYCRWAEAMKVAADFEERNK